jgi:hypothetical protein
MSKLLNSLGAPKANIPAEITRAAHAGRNQTKRASVVGKSGGIRTSKAANKHDTGQMRRMKIGFFIANPRF